jgi:hypothetical protein
MATYGTIFFGVLWKIGHDDEVDVEQLEEDIPNLKSAYHTREGWVAWLGVPAVQITDSSQDFDEMGLLRLMGTTERGGLTGSLDDSNRDKVRKMIQEVPMDLRNKFSAPGFFIAWGND